MPTSRRRLRLCDTLEDAKLQTEKSRVVARGQGEGAGCKRAGRNLWGTEGSVLTGAGLRVRAHWSNSLNSTLKTRAPPSTALTPQQHTS